MTTLNARAQSIRQATASALDGQQRDEIVMRAAGFTKRLDDLATSIAKARTAASLLLELGVVEGAAAATPSDRHLKKLLAEADKHAENLPTFLHSGLPGDIELAAREYERALDSKVKETWKDYASRHADSLGVSAPLFEKALGSIPRFRHTIEQVRLARLELSVLKSREIPTASQIREFQQHLATLKEANKELEGEVPDAYRNALRRCASPEGLPPADVPDGFFDWIHEIGASSYFKVALTS